MYAVVCTGTAPALSPTRLDHFAHCLTTKATLQEELAQARREAEARLEAHGSAALDKQEALEAEVAELRLAVTEAAAALRAESRRADGAVALVCVDAYVPGSPYTGCT